LVLQPEHSSKMRTQQPARGARRFLSRPPAEWCLPWGRWLKTPHSLRAPRAAARPVPERTSIGRARVRHLHNTCRRPLLSQSGSSLSAGAGGRSAVLGCVGIAGIFLKPGGCSLIEPTERATAVRWTRPAPPHRPLKRRPFRAPPYQRLRPQWRHFTATNPAGPFSRIN
jgi:hypothetical protein